MTDVQDWYQEWRDRGRGHNAALREIAADMGVDPGTVRGVLDRARANDDRARGGNRRKARPSRNPKEAPQ